MFERSIWQIKKVLLRVLPRPERKEMKRKMRNRHGVPRTLQLDYFGPNRHFIRNWLRKVIDTSHLEFVPRRFLYFWREPRFRMH